MKQDISPRKSTLATSAYNELRRSIILLTLPPGTKLQTRDLCARFGIGFSPLREALSRLVSEGLVQQQDHRGFAVAPLSVVDLDGLTKARCWLNEIGLRESIVHMRKASTRSSVWNVWASIGSWGWTTPPKRLNLGDASTMK